MVAELVIWLVERDFEMLELTLELWERQERMSEGMLVGKLVSR